MEHKNRRKSARSQAWKTTVATINVLNVAGYRNASIVGQVANLGSQGMFLKTSEVTPIHAAVSITIDFNSECPSKLRLNAYGEIVRRRPDGIGIKFTQINLDDLQECLLERIRMAQ